MLHKSVDHVVKWVNHVLDFGMFEVILRTILEINLNWNNRTEEVYMPKKCLLDCFEWEQKIKPTEVLTWEGEEVVGKRGEGVIFVAHLYLKKCFFNVVWKNFYKRRVRHKQWQFSTWLPRYRHCLTSNCMSLSQENIARQWKTPYWRKIFKKISEYFTYRSLHMRVPGNIWTKTQICWLNAPEMRKYKMVFTIIVWSMVKQLWEITDHTTHKLFKHADCKQNTIFAFFSPVYDE